MILVTGAITARPDSLDALKAISLAHVRRSRTEPGCLSHAVHADLEDPLRLVFVEFWESPEALQAHFALPESRAFVAEVRTLAAAPPELRIQAVRDLPGPGVS